MKREAKTYTIGDRTLTVKQWATEMKIPAGYIHNRLALGWSIERAVMTPVLTHGGRRALHESKPRENETHRVFPEREGSGYVPPPKSEKQLREEAADARIEEEIRKLRALVLVVPDQRHVDCDCSACLPPTY